MKLIDRIRKRHKVADDTSVGMKTTLMQEMRAVDGVNADTGKVIVTAVANTADVDLMDEVVVPSGCRMNAENQPIYFGDYKPIYLNHDYEPLPIGTLRKATLRADRWVCQFVIHGKTELSRDVQALLRLGADCPVRGTSIGFIRHDGHQAKMSDIEVYGPGCMYVTTEWTWMELSLTPQPCNPRAWVEGVSTAPEKSVCDSLDNLACRGIIGKSTLQALGVLPRPTATILPPTRKLLLVED